jgi:hypothetical protein
MVAPATLVANITPSSFFAVDRKYDLESPRDISHHYQTFHPEIADYCMRLYWGFYRRALKEPAAVLR